MTIVDITYTTNIGERQGRRKMCDNHTGETWWEEPKVEVPAFASPALTGAVTEYLETRKDPAPEPVKAKPKKKRLLHG